MKLLKIILLVVTGVAFGVAAILFFFGGDSAKSNPQDTTKEPDTKPELKEPVNPE